MEDAKEGIECWKARQLTSFSGGSVGSGKVQWFSVRVTATLGDIG